MRLGGKIEYLAIDEFQKQFGFTYNDGIGVDKDIRISPFNENITGDLSSAKLKKQVEKVLKEGCENLVICNMEKFGHGVFAAKDISKDTVVAVYGGTIIKGHQVSDERDNALGYYETNMSFSTRYHRGIASFMQHLPVQPKFKNVKELSQTLKMFGQNVSEDELKLDIEMYSTEFESVKTRELIATENVRREYLNVSNTPVIAMVTDTDVKFGDQLGFNYGFSYWLSRNVTPEFFNRNGDALSHKVYKRTFGRLNFGSFSYTGEYKPLINSLNQGRAFVRVVGDDKKSRQVSTMNLINLLLNANACRFEIDSQYIKNVLQLKNS